VLLREKNIGGWFGRMIAWTAQRIFEMLHVRELMARLARLMANKLSREIDYSRW